ncbi:helix-turn-helix transcriptional regulator [Mangrovimonas futianensis]|uniref:helix-turn-helix transcriptional regulator n=1 Tax=Mangrovimonas futianensis TaxID=2895523 RepID=UPI001E3A0639|nr:LuxR C-terminal-related transcriptional regulator [Mangrovimonas futianensis]
MKRCIFTCSLFMYLATLSGQNSIEKNPVLSDSLAIIAFNNKDFENYFKYFIQYENNLDSSKDSKFKVRSLYQHTERFFNLGLYQQSKELALKEIALDSDFDHIINATFTSLSYVILAKSQNALKEYQKAKQTYLEAIVLVKKISNHEKPLRLASALNNLGMQYLDYESNKDSALWYFQKAKEIMVTSSISNHPFFGVLNENIAHIEYDQGNYTIAKEYYQNNYANVFTLTGNDRLKRNHLLSGIYLSNTYLKLNQVSETKKVLNNIAISLDTIQNFRFGNEIEMAWLETSRELAEKEKNYQFALDLSKKLDAKKDSLHHEENQNKLLGSTILEEETINKYQTLIENERLKTANLEQINRTRFWITISTLLILLGIFIFLFSRYKQHLALARKNKEIAEQKAIAHSYRNQLLTKDLENQKQDLTNIALSTQQNVSWLEGLNDTITKYKRQGHFSKELFIKELLDSIEDKKRANTFTENLHEKIATINSEFYSKLKISHPDLTDYDIKLCTLIRINLESKDIATILNISPSSVNTSRYRIRKKLELSKGDNLTDYLKNI